MSQLLFHLYDDDFSNPTWLEDVTARVANVRLLWEIPGGIKTIELNLGLDRMEAWTWYLRRHGQRLVVLDSYMDRPVAEGQIFGVGLAPWGVRIVCMGPWKRLFDRLITDDPTDSDTTSAVLKSWLTSYASTVSSVQNKIGETSTQVGAWVPRDGGEYLGDVVRKFSAMSDSANRQWNFWLLSSGLTGMRPGKPLAYFEYQQDDAEVDWQLWQADLAPGGAEVERSILDLANNVVVRYSGGSNAQQATGAVSDTYSQGDYWRRDADVMLGQADATLAEQYRDLYLDRFKEPMLSATFTIGAPVIHDGGMGRWPLWRVIANGGGYLRFNDIYPDAAMLSSSRDRKQVGQIMIAEYDYAANQLRVGLDTEDNQLDAVLARAGLR